MKKLQKKTGRRAVRRRRRMARLVTEVTSERQDSRTSGEYSRNAAPKSAPQTESPSALTASTKPVASVAPNDQSGTKKATTASGLLQRLSMGSDRSSRRRRRMERIRQELARQADQASASRQERMQQKRDEDRAANGLSEEAAAVQPASPSSANDNPTAQSMVAIAGAVTALASAMQLRFSETQSSPPHGSEQPVSPPTDTSFPASTTAVTGAVVADQRQTDSEEDSDLPASDSEDPFSSSGNDEGCVASDSEAKTFDESFFDDDESDVAGAYEMLPPTEQPEETYREWFQRVIVRNKWMTWFTAFYVHWLILLLMMIVFVHGPENAGNLLLNGAFADTVPEEPEAFEIAASEPAVEEREPEPVVEPVTEQIATSELAEESVEISESLLKSLAAETSDAEPTESAEPTRKTPPTPHHSVSQGSFSVWTDPEYPTAGEPYRIIVQIQLPPGTKKYHLRDLTGVVVGSDGYRKPIPGINPGPLPIVDGCVRFVIPIVSADAEVRDTIFIRSKLLKETQKLLIEF